MVSAFAPHIINDTWAVAPFHVQLVACRRAHRRTWVMAGLSEICQFSAGVPISAKLPKGLLLSRSDCGLALLSFRRLRMAIVAWTPCAWRMAGSDP